MADKQFEEDDPMELVGFVMPAPDEGMMEDMAHAIVDEYLRMGWPPHAIVSLFRDPFYRAPHSILLAKGEAYVVKLVELVAGMKGK